MRIVVDTNTVISGLLWRGPPQEIINAARAKRITLYSSVTLAELIVSRDKRLRNLKSYHGIPIVLAAEALTRLPKET